MKLTVQCGAKAWADSLATIGEADTYHAARGNAAWATLAVQRKEELLRAATDYLQGEYGGRWPCGFPFGVACQPVDGVLQNLVPVQMKYACALLALRAADGPLDPEVAPQVKEQTVGPIKTVYADAAAGGRRQFPDVARLVGPFLVAVNLFSIPLRRA